MTADAEVVDLNVVRLARLVASVERAAGWCDWQARAVDDESEDDEPLSDDERIVLRGWCVAFSWVAEELRSVNRRQTPNEPLAAVRTICERLAAVIEQSDVAIEAGLESCETIPDLLETQGRLHGLRVARQRLAGLTRSDSDLPTPS